MPDEREHRLLATYLNDHYMASTAGLELARRARGSNRRTELGALLERLAGEIEEDREALRDVMRRLGVDVDLVKVAAGWAGEKLGRLKPNGRLLSYSPLSRVIELEGLSLGIEGKRLLWVSLGAELAGDGRVAEVDFTALAERAGRQREELEPHRLAAVAEALGPRAG